MKYRIRRGEIGMKFKHYKGNIYWLAGVAKHTETEEELAIYTDMRGGTWARPLEMFHGYVEHEGKLIKRFSKVTK